MTMIRIIVIVIIVFLGMIMMTMMIIIILTVADMVFIVVIAAAVVVVAVAAGVVASCGGYGSDGDSVCWLVACLTSQQHASVSQGRICSDNFTCCHTEIEVADPTFYLTQSQYTDTGPTSPSADPIIPGAWQGSHWTANFEVTGMTRPRKIPAQAGFEPWIFRSRGGRLNH